MHNCSLPSFPLSCTGFNFYWLDEVNRSITILFFKYTDPHHPNQSYWWHKGGLIWILGVYHSKMHSPATIIVKAVVNAPALQTYWPTSSKPKLLMTKRVSVLDILLEQMWWRPPRRPENINIKYLSKQIQIVEVIMVQCFPQVLPTKRPFIPNSMV